MCEAHRVLYNYALYKNSPLVFIIIILLFIQLFIHSMIIHSFIHPFIRLFTSQSV